MKLIILYKRFLLTYNYRNIMMNIKNSIFILLIATLQFTASAQVNIIPCGQSQADFLNACKMVFEYASENYTDKLIQSGLFPQNSEYSIYWAKSGQYAGGFILNEDISDDYASVTSVQQSGYDLFGGEHYAVNYQHDTSNIAIFRSSLIANNTTISWQYSYFANVFNSYLLNDMYFITDENSIINDTSLAEAKLLVIPAFTVNGSDQEYYIDQLFSEYPQLKKWILKFLQNGGTIYTEGNAAYFIEKLGILDEGSVDYAGSADKTSESNLKDIQFEGTLSPLKLTQLATGNELFAGVLPTVSINDQHVIARETESNNIVAFQLSNFEANGGKIICNLGLPTLDGMLNIAEGSRQIQWFLNSVVYAFSSHLDVTRRTYNEMTNITNAASNAVPYDYEDEFQVQVTIRNLTSANMHDVAVKEIISPFFSFVNMDGQFSLSGDTLLITGLEIPPSSEQVIRYTLQNPSSDEPVYEDIDNYIDAKNQIIVSENKTTYRDYEGNHRLSQQYNYAQMMFSAQLEADADLNWKNFLGLDYQPFKVFMIMENKSRSSAEEAKFVQYIPRDVPFYRVDHGLNIPVLKTPGGEYIDVMRGSVDEDNPEFDMDSDGHPDAWLDTSSIYPKGYVIEEDSVYWLNPWGHLHSEDSASFYEDLDHDGKRAEDTDGDGIVDIPEPGDMLKVWKVTWDIGQIPGYQYYDPYTSYEIWVDPPDLVPLSAGVGYAFDSIPEKSDKMFYPFAPDIDSADLSDPSWKRWMEKDSSGNILWKQFILQKINNYEGFTFIDTTEQDYKLKPTDSCLGTAPQPHREFIAVLSLGGEEIDMKKYKPTESNYSKINYETNFGEAKEAPLRTVYTYYAPLPNPLQFEYLTNNYQVFDIETGQQLEFLPSNGKARIQYDMDASTEYTYYWIRNVGYDVDYNDPSLEKDSIEEYGDGVFGYLIYDIPKGMGGYDITLPKNEDGTYDIDSIVTIDGNPFEKWIDNEHTEDSVMIWEDAFQYHVYIPQLLIPPALDDDNNDSIDDWIDDRGDRFCSETGFLHDEFMPGNGETFKDYPFEPFKDDIYGMVDSGWYAGPDNTYGDDFFEKMGKTHIRINATYEGDGREGPVEVSKGGWLVVEEIFGGSPWVIFSHVMSGWAEGVDIQVRSSASVDKIDSGIDTILLKHEIFDENEPHVFDYNYNPYHMSRGYDDASFTVLAGGKDPCSFLEPDISTTTIVDPDNQKVDLTIMPLADPEKNPDLTGYPDTISGVFLEIKVEVTNHSDNHWKKVNLEPVIPKEAGSTEVVFNYVAYPRPLVPGDNFSELSAGWRFNEPEQEVLVLLGDTLPQLHSGRKAYFISLIKIDEGLENGIYDIDFSFNAEAHNYAGDKKGSITFDVPKAQFAVTKRTEQGQVMEFSEFVIGQADLDSLSVATTDKYEPLLDVRWAGTNVNHTDFDTLSRTLPVDYNSSTRIETIDMSGFRKFPNADTSKIVILEKGVVNTSQTRAMQPAFSDQVTVTSSENLSFHYRDIPKDTADGCITIYHSRPNLILTKSIYSVNDQRYTPDDPEFDLDDNELILKVFYEITNNGNDAAVNAELTAYSGPLYSTKEDSAYSDVSLVDGNLVFNIGLLTAGESKQYYFDYYAKTEDVHENGSSKSLTKTSEDCDPMAVVCSADVQYQGMGANNVPVDYEFNDTIPILFSIYEFKIIDFSTVKPEYEHGDIVEIVVNAENTLVTAEDVWFKLIMIYGGDSILLKEQTVQEWQKGERFQMNHNYTIPDSIYFLNFIILADANEDYFELSEKNNSDSLQLKIQGPKGFRNVKVYPNPFFESVNINYTLAADMKDIMMSVYGPDRKLIDQVSECPNNFGVNTLNWSYPNLPAGTYLFKLLGFDIQGIPHQYLGKFMKMRPEK